jgi:thymidine phosphorylase
MEVTLSLGAELLMLAKRDTSLATARARLEQTIESGAALDRFREMVTAQGGDLDAPRPVSPVQEVHSQRSGFITAMDTEQLGRVIIELGGGRKRLGDVLDRSVGFEMLVRLGDQVDKGQPLLRVFAKRDDVAKIHDELLGAITIRDNRVEPPPLIVERIA